MANQFNLAWAQANARTGICLSCKKKLTNNDEDHSICNACWDIMEDEDEV